MEPPRSLPVAVPRTTKGSFGSQGLASGGPAEPDPRTPLGGGGASRAEWVPLCRLEDIPDGRARGLLRRGLDDQVCAVRQGGEVFVWLNDCPHEHRPMEYRQDQFLSGDGGHITCYAHSAHFDIRTGLCFAGPCTGEHLIRVPSRIDPEGRVWIPAELPNPFD